MKRILCALVAAVLSMAAGLAGDDDLPTTLTTLNGKVYEKVRILKAYPHGVAFAHAGGAAQIPFTDLPETWRTRFNFDPGAAKAYVDGHVRAEKEALAAAKARQAARNQSATYGSRRSWAPAVSPGPVYGPDYGYGYGGYYDGGWLPGYGRACAGNGVRWNGRNTIANRYSNTPSFLMFGGYTYPTPRYGAGGFFARPTTQQFLQGPRVSPLGSGGARIGGTGLLFQTASPSILHR